MDTALFRRKDQGRRSARQVEEELVQNPGNAQLWLRHAEACLRENLTAVAGRSYGRAAEIFLAEGHQRRAEVANNLARQCCPVLSLVKPTPTPVEDQVAIDADPPTLTDAREQSAEDPFEAVTGDVQMPGPNDVTVRVTCVFDLRSVRPREEPVVEQKAAPKRRQRGPQRPKLEITEVDIDIEALEAVGGSF